MIAQLSIVYSAIDSICDIINFVFLFFRHFNEKYFLTFFYLNEKMALFSDSEGVTLALLQFRIVSILISR